MTDVPKIIPAGAGNAHEVFSAAARSGQSLWMSHRRQMIVVSTTRPAQDFTRMGWAEKTEPLEAA